VLAGCFRSELRPRKKSADHESLLDECTSKAKKLFSSLEHSLYRLSTSFSDRSDPHG
jgi:hypothetical protein